MKSTRHFRLIILAVLVASAIGHSVSAAAERESTPNVRVLVPAYFYPSGRGLREWEKLISSPGPAAIVAIVNPASGPGASADANYVAVIKRARRAGITLIGYVTTSYAKRSVDDVKADVDRWLRLYPGIDGIFFDEQSSAAKDVDKQAVLYDYVRKARQLRLVVTNPGTICDEGFLSRPTADCVCLSEGPLGADSLRLPAWTSRHPASRMAVLPYKVATTEEMRSCVRKAVKNRFGVLYVTDAHGAIPWDRLPRYWAEELELVQELNKEKR